jgi:hypothetical protein
MRSLHSAKPLSGKIAPGGVLAAGYGGGSNFRIETRSTNKLFSSTWGVSTVIRYLQRAIYVFVFILLISACAPASTPTLEPRVVSVYSTPVTQPWLADVFACAPAETVIRVADSSAEADISLHLGEPDILVLPAFQIDTEEILVVTHRQSPVQNMTVEEVRELFAGQGDPSVQVWVYSAGEDVQKMFAQVVMGGRSVTSSARLAIGTQHMSDMLNNTPDTIGILPRRWKAGDSRFVYTIPDVPVLAIVKEEPQDEIQALIACLQIRKI